MGITTSGLHDIILLHDWYACNAPKKTYVEMGFANDDEFMAFRRRCNKISFNLRCNQYAKMLSMRREKIQNYIHELKMKLNGFGLLKHHDKYGKDAWEELEPEWSIEDVDPNKVLQVEDFVGVGEDLAFEEPRDRVSVEIEEDKISKFISTGNEYAENSILPISKPDVEEDKVSKFISTGDEYAKNSMLPISKPDVEEDRVSRFVVAGEG